MYAVCVTFEIHEAKIKDFMPLMRENAATSLKEEVGCHQFDVCTDPARPAEVFLYEIYADRAAFDIHLASHHFKRFDAAVAPMIASKLVKTYAAVHS